MPFKAATSEDMKRLAADPWGDSSDEAWNWTEAFDVACRDRIESVPPGTTHRTDPFVPTDVAEVIASVDGENDGDEWVGVFRLHDGRFVTVTAGCDYTGWG